MGSFMMCRSALRMSVVLLLTACGGGETTGPTPPPPPPPPSGVDRVVLAPASVTLEPGGQAALIAVAIGVQGDTLAGIVVAWSSAAAQVVTVSGTGVITAVAPGGPVTITATAGGKSATTIVTVAPPAVSRVVLAPDSIVVQRDSTRSLTVRVEDGNGQALTGRTVTWTTLNGIVATVSQSGAVLGVNFGRTGIVATSEGRSDTAIVVVQPPPALIAVVRIQNRLAYPAEVLIDGNSRAIVPATGTLELAVPKDRPARLSWALIPPIDQFFTLGELVSDSFPTIQAPQGTELLEITATLSDGRRYFDPVLTNTATSTVIDFPVRFSAVPCPCVAASNGQANRGYGLWVLSPASTLVLYGRTDVNKVGPSLTVPVPSAAVDPVTGVWAHTITQSP